MAIITGTNANDQLTGTDLSDSIDGLKGADHMTGGKGDDAYYVDNTLDTVTELAGEGYDFVVSTATVTQLWDNVEEVDLAGTGAINATGNGLDNYMLGNTGNNVIDGGAGADEMVGGKGDDTYKVDNANDKVIESAGAGTDTVISTISYGLGADVENLTLAGTNNISAFGNALNNVLIGNDGNNLLSGGLGNDTMTGGKGDDTYVVDSIGDKVVESVTNATGGGVDTVFSSIDFSLAALVNVENLTLAGSASHATGNDLANHLVGTAVANVIDGGKGADTMEGGAGDDTYYIDNAGDVVVEKANEGVDTVYSTIALTNAIDNVENYHFQVATPLNFTGNDLGNAVYGGSGKDSLEGAGGNDSLNGNAGDDTLIGDSGDDVLDGGVGADHMTGGAGSDTYYVDNALDTVTEMAGGGDFDLAYSAVTVTKLWDNVENLILTGTGAINGTGNDLGNVIVGNAGNNVIDGGAGADQMFGGKGSDTYIVDNANDTVVEALNEGTDTVKSSVSFGLGDNLENLTLTGSGNTAAFGNTLDNILLGNDGNNILSGGTGKDSMTGGKGDDIYIVDNVGDSVVESVTNANGGGHDAVYSSIDFSLASLMNVEDLVLTGFGGHGTGNTLDNTIQGSSLDDVIDGGKGADTMIGGDGWDTYYIDNAGDKVQEGANGGSDTVYSTIAFTNAIDNVETYYFQTSSAVNFTGSNVPYQSVTGGSGNDTITGGSGFDYLNGDAGNDTLNGGAGNDTLVGGTGADHMTGGTGNDTYYVDNALDTVSELIGGGTWDTVRSTVTVTKLWDNVEELDLDGTGAINATGNDLKNNISGNDGNNVIDGGADADLMYGNKGNDTFIVDNAGDQVIEYAGQGTDLVKSSVSFDLGSDVENLTLTGADNINAHGNALDNILVGNDGNNILYGGAGKDSMTGGKGDDTYVVDNVGDTVIETVANNAGGGNDLVYSSIDFSLAALANVESLWLTGSVGLHGTGNALDNIIHGSAGSDFIDGGKGADTMVGLDGSDVYSVDNAGDVVVEVAGQGYDTVISTVALGNAFDNVETYKFTTSVDLHFTANGLDNSVEGGSGKDTIDGGAGNDYLHGMAGDDTLTGGIGNDFLSGDAGADHMTGGSGDDTYFIDNAKDVVTESANGGLDTVVSAITLTNLFDNVEVAALSGTGNINLTGNTLDNLLMGNGGSNTIDGGVGKDTIDGSGGNDILIGGAGADTFDFHMQPTGIANDGHDTIKDFVKAEDVLSFDHVQDHNNDGNITLDDLLGSVSSVVDHGAGKDVDFHFDNGGIVTFTGAGTGAVDAITDMVANATTQIHVS